MERSQPPRYVVRGLDGSVLVPAGIAAELAPDVLAMMRSKVRNGDRRYSDGAWEALDAPMFAARTFRGDVATGVVIATVAEGDPATVEAVEELTVTEAAALLGVHRQAVLARIARKTLPARRDQRGRHLVRRYNLEGPA